MESWKSFLLLRTKRGQVHPLDAKTVGLIAAASGMSLQRVVGVEDAADVAGVEVSGAIIGNAATTGVEIVSAGDRLKTSSEETEDALLPLAAMRSRALTDQLVLTEDPRPPVLPDMAMHPLLRHTCSLLDRLRLWMSVLNKRRKYNSCWQR